MVQAASPASFNVTPNQAPRQSEALDLSGVVNTISQGVTDLLGARAQGKQADAEREAATFIGTATSERLGLALEEQYASLTEDLGPQEREYLQLLDSKKERLQFLREQGKGAQVYRVRENELLLSALKERPDLSQEIITRFKGVSEFTDRSIEAQEKENAARQAEIQAIGKAARKNLVSLGLADPDTVSTMSDEAALATLQSSPFGQVQIETERLRITAARNEQEKLANEYRRENQKPEVAAVAHTAVLAGRVQLLEALRSEADPAKRRSLIIAQRIATARGIAENQDISEGEVLEDFGHILDQYNDLNQYDPLASDAQAEGNRALLIENQMRSEAALHAQGYLATSEEAREYRVLTQVFGANNVVLQNEATKVIQGALSNIRLSGGGSEGGDFDTDRTFIPTGRVGRAGAATDRSRLQKARNLAPQIKQSLTEIGKLPEGIDRTELMLTTMSLINNEVNQDARAAFLSSSADWFATDLFQTQANSLAALGDAEVVGKYRQNLGEYALRFVARVEDDIIEHVELDEKGLPKFVAPQVSSSRSNVGSRRNTALRAQVNELRKLVLAANHLNQASGVEEEYAETLSKLLGN